MKRRILGSVAMLSALALSPACGDDEAEGKDTGATCPSDNTLSYDNFGKAFFTSYCLACHNTQKREEGYDFSTLANIQDAITEIDHVAAAGPNATNTAMPDGIRLTVEQRTQLGQWLACGAK
jgi:uncharacterized membrane protein